MESQINWERRRSSGFSGVSSCFTADSGISSDSAGNSLVSDVNSELFVSRASGSGYPIVQCNGCKKFGPPLHYQGEEPSPECELFIKDFPRDYQEFQLIPHFERFGEIYDFRLMMDYDNNNRGYAYIRFLKKEAADTALDVMRYFLLPNGSVLQVQKSYNKCRLFVSNLPTDVSQKQVKDVFQHIFPKLCDIVLYVNELSNRAFGFLDFPDHNSALEAKRLASPGTLDLFGRQVKIVWAYPERQMEHSTKNSVKTLFIRNIGLHVNTASIKMFLMKAVPSKAIKNITTVRDFAFIDLINHAAAKKVKDELNGQIVCKSNVEIEFARPPSEDSIHNLKQTDFDQKLRLKCIANYWAVPIYLYGRVYEDKKIQNACIIIKTELEPHYYFYEINYTDLVDIQSRIAEVIVQMIDHFSHLPSENLVIKVEKEYFAVVGFMKNMKISPTFIPYVKYPNVTIFFEEILDLALMANALGNWSTPQLYLTYQNHIVKPENTAFLENLIVHARILGCHNPRVNTFGDTPLPFLQNQEMIFVLCCAYYYNNVKFFNKAPNQYYLQQFFKTAVIYHHQYIMSMHLLPLRFVQTKRYNGGSPCQNITYGNYLPEPDVEAHQYYQRLRQPWFWLPNPLTQTVTPVMAPVGLTPMHSVQLPDNMPLPVPTHLRSINSNAF